MELEGQDTDSSLSRKTPTMYQYIFCGAINTELLLTFLGLFSYSFLLPVSSLAELK